MEKAQEITPRIHHIRNGGYLWVFKHDPHSRENGGYPVISTRIPNGTEVVNDITDEDILPTCFLELPLEHPEDCVVIPVKHLFDSHVLLLMQGWMCAKMGTFDIITKRVVCTQNIDLIMQFLEQADYLQP